MTVVIVFQVLTNQFVEHKVDVAHRRFRYILGKYPFYLKTATACGEKNMWVRGGGGGVTDEPGRPELGKSRHVCAP